MKNQYFAIVLFSFATCLHAQDPQSPEKKDPSEVVKEGTIGNVKVTVKGRNVDSSSQWRSEWKNRQKDRQSEPKKSRFRKEKDDEKEDSSEVSVIFSWPAKD